MTRGEALKRLLGGFKADDDFLLMVVDDDMNTIGVSDAIRIWEKLNEELPGTKKMDPNPEKLLAEKPQRKKAADKKKRKLDDGKMLALRKAGWSYEKIADEMHCATQTVINHIRDKE